MKTNINRAGMFIAVMPDGSLIPVEAHIVVRWVLKDLDDPELLTVLFSAKKIIRKSPRKED